MRQTATRAAALVFGLLGVAQALPAQVSPAASAPSPAPAPVVAADAYGLTDRLWLSVQANIVSQQHSAFDAAYSGPDSLLARRERATSRVETLYTGFRVTRRLELLFDVESVGGGGLSGAHGLGGPTNVDAPGDPALREGPYVARAMVHYTIPRARETVLVTRNPLSLTSTAPARRLEIRAGKLSAADFFDLNSAANDSHSQFTNAALVNNGAYDYASDARGYTYGAVIEYEDVSWAARFGELLIPEVGPANATRWNPARAHGENLEIEVRPARMLKRPSIIRALAFVNRGRTGTYRDAIDGYRAGLDVAPTTARYLQSGTTKWGIGLNAEHQLTDAWRAFWRAGWNDGSSDTIAIDRTVQAGIDLRGVRRHRPDDAIGSAIVVNGLSSLHRQYLALGGRSAGLGDGALRYGTERIVETYYNAALWRGVSVAVSYQFISHPGYNRDRGPASVVGFRIHLENAIPFERFLGAREAQP